MDEMRTPVRDIGPPEDRYAMWDAAYVLGSLSAAQRREFETHMAHCPACRSAVADLSGVPTLLSQLDRDEVAAIDQSGPAPEMSAELLPSLLATVRWRRRRTRVVTWVASTAAAACPVAVTSGGLGGFGAPVPRRLVTHDRRRRPGPARRCSGARTAPGQGPHGRS